MDGLTMQHKDVGNETNDTAEKSKLGSIHVRGWLRAGLFEERQVEYRVAQSENRLRVAVGARLS